MQYNVHRHPAILVADDNRDPELLNAKPRGLSRCRRVRKDKFFLKNKRLDLLSTEASLIVRSVESCDTATNVVRIPSRGRAGAINGLYQGLFFCGLK